MRVALDYIQTDSFLGGNRFYIGYAGAAPTAANCTAIADAIETAWTTNLAPLTSIEWGLKTIDVIDIASLTGASGQWNGTSQGQDSGSALPAQVAVNIEFSIARRYRGGKPRIYLPPPDAGKQADAGHWSGTFTAAMDTAFEAFIAAVEAIDVGAVGQLTHVNLSYYTGFKNITNSSGRERAVPQYRTEALVEPVTGYHTKTELSSQRRRRVATAA